jgi:hypothetical protein
MLGRHPAAPDRTVARHAGPLQEASASPHSGGHPLRELAATLRAGWRAGWRRTAAVGHCRCARQCSDQGCAFIASTTARSGRRCRHDHDSGPFPSPGIAGSWSFTLRVNAARLGVLTGLPITALCFGHCMPARSSSRSPATPDAGRLKGRVCSQRFDHRAGRCAGCPSTAAALCLVGLQSLGGGRCIGAAVAPARWRAHAVRRTATRSFRHGGARARRRS